MVFPVSLPQVKPAVRFGTSEQFAQKLGVKKEDVEANLPELLSGLDLAPVLSKLSGKDRVDFANAVNALAASAKKAFPKGDVKFEDGHYVITSYDNNEGKASITKVNAAVRPNVKVLGRDVKTVKEFLADALGPQPRLIISPVGWTIPDPNVLIQNNKVFADKAANLREALVGKYGADHPELDKKYQKGIKTMADNAYQTAFNNFWSGVDNYLFNDLGLKAKDVAFVTSASYAGIDKAAMDFAKNRNIDVVNITPYCYAEWMDTNLKHPLLVTESVDDYAKACAEAANLLLVTGGRGHAYQQDFKRFMVDENKAVLAVDVMKEGLNLKVPALNKGVVDNAAALLIEKGFNAENADFAKNVRNAANLTPMQRVVAGALETLHRQFTFTNEKAIAEKL